MILANYEILASWEPVGVKRGHCCVLISLTCVVCSDSGWLVPKLNCGRTSRMEEGSSGRLWSNPSGLIYSRLTYKKRRKQEASQSSSSNYLLGLSKWISLTSLTPSFLYFIWKIWIQIFCLSLEDGSVHCHTSKRTWAQSPEAMYKPGMIAWICHPSLGNWRQRTLGFSA